MRPWNCKYVFQACSESVIINSLRFFALKDSFGSWGFQDEDMLRAEQQGAAGVGEGGFPQHERPHPSFCGRTTELSPF